MGTEGLNTEVWWAWGGWGGDLGEGTCWGAMCSGSGGGRSGGCWDPGDPEEEASGDAGRWWVVGTGEGGWQGAERGGLHVCLLGTS